MCFQALLKRTVVETNESGTHPSLVLLSGFGPLPLLLLVMVPMLVFPVLALVLLLFLLLALLVVRPVEVGVFAGRVQRCRLFRRNAVRTRYEAGRYSRVGPVAGVLRGPLAAHLQYQLQTGASRIRAVGALSPLRFMLLVFSHLLARHFSTNFRRLTSENF